nr:hypothetical protein [Tanacetum cinerariifolium]
MFTQFPNQTSIYTPTAAYATYHYETSPHQEYLLEFTSEYGIPEILHSKLPGPEDRMVDFPKGKAKKKYPSMLYQAIRFPEKLKQPLLLGGREGIPDYCGLAHKCSEGWDTSREYLFPGGCDDTEHASHPNPETTRGTTLFDRVELQILPRRRDMDLFSLIHAPNPTKVKTSTRPRAANEVLLLSVTASRVIEMEDPAATTNSSGVPSTIERSPLDFANENPMPQSTGLEDRVQETVAPELGMGSTRPLPASQGAPVDMSDPDPLSFAEPQSHPSADVAQSSKGAATVVAGDPESENTSFTSMVGSPESIYQPELGITNGCLLDAPEACQDIVNHIAPSGYFSELHHLHNDDFLNQYNVTLEWQVAMGSKLRLRCIVFRSLSEQQRLSQQVSTLQAQVMREEKMKAAFEEFKQYEDNRVEQHCAKMDARLDALGIDFDKELYPHMLTTVAGRRWVIGHGLRLAVMKCGESTELRQAFADVVSAGIAKGMSEVLKHEVEHGKANLSLEAIEAFDPEAKTKYIADLHALKNLKYPIVDQFESLKDAPMDVIMAPLHLESDTGDDAP